mgnify:CR=1 FL=1
MPKFRKKPAEIEARLFNGQNGEMIAEWCGGTLDRPMNGPYAMGPAKILIPTLEGTMEAIAGSWIIQGVQGEFYLCKQDIFESTYEEVEDE